MLAVDPTGTDGIHLRARAGAGARRLAGVPVGDARRRHAAAPDRGRHLAGAPVGRPRHRRDARGRAPGVGARRAGRGRWRRPRARHGRAARPHRGRHDRQRARRGRRAHRARRHLRDAVCPLRARRAGRRHRCRGGSHAGARRSARPAHRSRTRSAGAKSACPSTARRCGAPRRNCASVTVADGMVDALCAVALSAGIQSMRARAAARRRRAGRRRPARFGCRRGRGCRDRAPAGA